MHRCLRFPRPPGGTSLSGSPHNIPESHGCQRAGTLCLPDRSTTPRGSTRRRLVSQVTNVEILQCRSQAPRNQRLLLRSRQVKTLARLALALVVFYAVAACYDACSECDSGRCPPSCHFSCVDGCSAAPIETTAVALVRLELTEYRQAQAVELPLDLTFPPDLIPPRG